MSNVSKFKQYIKTYKNLYNTNEGNFVKNSVINIFDNISKLKKTLKNKKNITSF